MKLFRLSWQEGDPRELFLFANSAEEAAKSVNGELVDHLGDRGADKMYCFCESDLHVRFPKSLFTSPQQEKRFGKHWWYDIAYSHAPHHEERYQAREMEFSPVKVEKVTVYYIFRDQEAMECCLEEVPHLAATPH